MRCFLSVVVVAAAGLFAGQVRGQFHDGFGLMDDGLAPRSWPLAVAKPPLLGKRDGSCASGSHPCSDVNSTSCCSNTQYCIINTSWEVQCCAIGSVCGNPCDADHYLANETVTTTITSSASTSASVTALVTTTTTTVEIVCSGRSCSSSFYGCPSSLGGGCCGYGQNCATNTAGAGICIGVSSAATTTTGSTTSSSNTALPTGAVIEHKSSGLSTGAKAGIAIGVIVVAALIIGALTYLCLRRRRRRLTTSARSETTTAQELPSMTPAGRGGAAGAAGAAAASAAAASSTNRAPQMSEADGDGVSYGYAPSSTGISRGGGGGGNAPGAQGDYFGEMIGPQEQQAQEQQQEHHHQAGGHHHHHPHDPDSVVAPVEIGTTRASLRRRGGQPATTGAAHHSRMDSQGSEGYDGSQSELADTSSQRGGPSPAFGGGGGGGPASPVESIAGRFELYGDFGHATTTTMATTTSGQGEEEFHDAQESVGGGERSRGMVAGRGGGGGGGGSGAVLPQPFPTPGSEMSEFATPSPMSREEEAQFRREV